MSYINENDYIPQEEFSEWYRFSDKKYSNISMADLLNIFPLGDDKANEIHNELMKYFIPYNFDEDLFSKIVSFDINTDKSTELWLENLAINPETQVIVSWGLGTCAVVKWKVFCDYWNVFFFQGPDDIFIYSNSHNWIIYFMHEGIISVGTCKSKLTLNNDPRSILPKNNYDTVNAKLTISMKPDELLQFINDIFEWIQDLNWPVARIIGPYLHKFGIHSFPILRTIFKSDDEDWIYFSLIEVVDKLPVNILKQLKFDLERLTKYSKTKQYKEVCKESEKLLQKLIAV